jgi:hypothetical protein
MIKTFTYSLLNLKSILPISGFLPAVDAGKLLSPVTESPVLHRLGAL